VKNVLIALPNDSLGGAEQYLKNLALFFSENEYIVTVLFLKNRNSGGWDDLKELNGVQLIFTSSDTELRGVLGFLKNLFELRRIRFDYTFTSHVHLTGLLGLLIKLRVLKKVFFIGRESTSIFRRFTGLKLLSFKLQYRLGYSSLDLLICQTTFMKLQLIEALPWLSKKIDIEVLPNPINLNNVSSNEIVDEKFGDFIVSAGRLIHEKGFDILIKAFRIVKINYPYLKLVILGEGEKRLELERLIQDNDLENDVFMPGFVKNVYPFFCQAELCVVSSRIEGFPNVLLQMMSQNANVVSTLCAGDIDAIDGLVLSEANDIDSLKNAILISLTKNSDKNLVLFQNELDKRSIDNFVIKIYTHLITKSSSHDFKT